MKGHYKTKEGSKVEVVNFDEANKIVMIRVDELRNRWVDETEYREWESLDEKPVEPQPEEITIPYEETPTTVLYEEPTTDGLEFNPIVEDAPPEKKEIAKPTVKKEVKKTTKPKKK